MIESRVENDCENGAGRTDHIPCPVSGGQRSALGVHRLPDPGAGAHLRLRHHHAAGQSAGHNPAAAECTTKRKIFRFYTDRNCLYDIISRASLLDQEQSLSYFVCFIIKTYSF